MPSSLGKSQARAKIIKLDSANLSLAIIIKRKELEMGLNEKLKNTDESFDRMAIPEILELNKQYRKDNPNKYGYNQAIVDYIMELQDVSESNRAKVSHEVYLSQEDLRNEKKTEYKEKMLKDGWTELTEEAIKDAFDKKQKIEVIATQSTDWLSVKIAETYKPFVDNQGTCYLMKPRARSRGLWVGRLENAFYKIKEN